MKVLKHISYSYLHTLACPYQAFLRYEAGIKTKLTDALVLGNSLHAALEKGHRQEKWDLDHVVNIFLNKYKEDVDKHEVFITWPKMKKAQAEGVEMLEVYDYQIQQGKIKHPPAYIEKEFRIPFEDEILVIGKIDKIDKEGDDYIVTDYKSGSREPDDWFLRHDLQLTCYAWAIQELFGVLPKKVVWHHLRSGRQLETVRTQDDINDLKTMLHNAIQMNKMGIRYRVFHSQICKWCEFSGPGGICEDRELEKKLVEQRDKLHGNTPSETP